MLKAVCMSIIWFQQNVGLCVNIGTLLSCKFLCKSKNFSQFSEINNGALRHHESLNLIIKLKYLV